MAGERPLPGLGLWAYWTLGSDNWHTKFDPDMRKLSALVQSSVTSRTTSLPGSPTHGDFYIVPVGDANANAIAGYDVDTWIYLTPHEGCLVYIKDDDEFVKWTGSAWVVLAVASELAPLVINDQVASYTLVLADAGKYVRLTVATANNLTVPLNATVAFAIGTTIAVRSNGAGQTTVVATGGVTINTAETLKLRKQGSTATLIKVATNTWDLSGDLELAP